MRKLITVLCLAPCFILLSVIVSFADDPPVRSRIINTCHEYTLCTAQTATGDCTVLPASGDEVVLETFGQWSALTFFSNLSVGAPYSCHVHGNASGHDAESGDFAQLTTVPLSDTNESTTLLGGNFGAIWVNCATITTSVTITVNACPSNR